MSSEGRLLDLGDIRLILRFSEDGKATPLVYVSAMPDLTINGLDALSKVASAAAEKLKQLADGARYE